MIERLVNIENKIDILSREMIEFKSEIKEELKEIRKLYELLSDQKELSQNTNKAFIIVGCFESFNFIIYLYSNYFKISTKF